MERTRALVWFCSNASYRPSPELCLPSVCIFESWPHEHLAGCLVDAARLFGEAQQAQASSAQAVPIFPPSTNFHIRFDGNWVNKQPLQGLPYSLDTTGIL